MKQFTNFLLKLFGPSLVTLIEALHVRLLNDWIDKPDSSFIHPHCTWKLADDHPGKGTGSGWNFYNGYIQELARTYSEWHEVVSETIGSRIGGVVVGDYQFQRKENGIWYSAPFTHFYQIRQGKIIGVRYYIGKVSIHPGRSQQVSTLSIPITFYSLN